MRNTKLPFNSALCFILLAACYFTGIPSARSQWVKSIGGPNADYGQSITTDANGNVYVIGDFRGKADFDPGPGTFFLTSSCPCDASNPLKPDIFFAKYNKAGALVWARKVGGSGTDNSKAIGVDAGGNVYIIGTFELTADFDPGNGIHNLTSNGGQDIFLAKYNSKGEFVWANDIGGAFFDYGNSLFVSSTGIVTIAGAFAGSVDFDPSAASTVLDAGSSSDPFFARYDAAGKLVWVKDIAGTGESAAQSIFIDAAGAIYIAGNFFGTSDFDPGTGTFSLTGVDAKDPFFAKYTSSGDLTWAASLSGAGDQAAQSIIADNSGNAYITGYFTGKVDFDPGPKKFNLTSSPGSFNSYILKLDKKGKFLWANNIGGPQDDIGFSLAIDANQVVYATGYFSGTADFSSVLASETIRAATLTSAGSTDIYVAGYTQAGQLLFAKNAGGATDDWANSIAADDSGFVYLTGYYTGTASFTNTPNTIKSAGNADVYIWKLKALETVYCKSQGNSSAKEWISLVNLSSDLNNKSGRDNGYGDYTTKTATLEAGASYDVTLNAGFDSIHFNEAWSGWIDYNKDGDFDDPGELIFRFTSSETGPLFGTFTLPIDAGGVTRMRIAMKRNTYSNPCDTFAKGEVEDYTINIRPQTPPSFSYQKEPGVISKPATIFPNPVRNFLTVNTPLNKNNLLQVYDATGRMVISKREVNLYRVQLDVSGLIKGVYILKITDDKGNSETKKWLKQ